jgi:hypothetical protein
MVLECAAAQYGDIANAIDRTPTNNAIDARDD